MMRQLFAALLLWAGLAAAPALAQSNNVLVVPTCGTQTLNAGQNYLGVLTVDTTGKLCTAAASSGTTSVTQGAPAATANSWPVKLTDGTNGPVTLLPPFIDSANPAFLLGTASQNYLYNGTSLSLQRDVAGASLATGFGVAATAVRPTSSANAGIVPVVSAAAEATHVLKASAGNLYSVFAANHTATAGFLLVLNATAAPADGAVTPLDCAALPANGNASISYNPGPASVFSTGITAVLSSGASCFTKTTGVITGFIRGSVQ